MKQLNEVKRQEAAKKQLKHHCHWIDRSDVPADGIEKTNGHE